MRLRTGIPLLTELDAHLKSDEYRQHVEFNRQFLQANDAAMERYGRLWAKDTLRLWSRRWEYPFVAQRVIELAAEQPDEPLRVLDAGSGVTYFPYYLCANLPRAHVVCYDSNPSYHPMFAAINQANPAARVKFVEGMLQQMPFEPVAELSRMDKPEDDILTTDYIRRTEPDLLPWKHPALKAAHDLVTGYGWTGGFRSKSIYCLDARKIGGGK